jgi:hypothetical protein
MPIKNPMPAAEDMASAADLLAELVDVGEQLEKFVYAPTKRKATVVSLLIRHLLRVNDADLVNMLALAKRVMELIVKHQDVTDGSLAIRLTLVRKAWSSKGLDRSSPEFRLINKALKLPKVNSRQLVTKREEQVAANIKNPVLLNYDKIKTYVETLNESTIGNPFNSLVLLMLTTGVRFKELFDSQFTPVDDDPCVFWHSEQAKSGRKHFNMSFNEPFYGPDPAFKKRILFGFDFDWLQTNVENVRTLLTYDESTRSILATSVKRASLAFLEPNSPPLPERLGTHFARKIYVGVLCRSATKPEVADNVIAQAALGHQANDWTSLTHYQGVRVV